MMARAAMETAKVITQEQLQEGIYSLWLSAAAARTASPGQFVNLYSPDGSRRLPRPISVCEADGDALRLVYRVAGEGTREFSALTEGDAIRMLAPLGNGFFKDMASGKGEDAPCLLLGGGIGVPPMLFLTRRLIERGSVPVVVLGYLDAPFLLDEFLATGARVVVSTESGSFGTKGNVMDALEKEVGRKAISGDWQIFSCGPMPMLRAVKAFAEERQVEACYLSMEERMACGIGACLGCVTPTPEVDGHSKVHNKRVCKDGPVFLAREVTL